MKRPIQTLAIALLLGILAGAALASAQQEAYTRIFAFIANGQAPPSLTILDTGDNSFIDSERSPAGCTFLAYIDRDNGNRLLIKQDAGNKLIDVPLPPATRARLDAIGRELARNMPGFAAPGEKQADGSLLIVGSTLSIYFTGRVPGDEAGKFQLQRQDIPLPACQV